MKKLQKSAREEIRNKYAQHVVYNVIKATERSWFNLVPSYRLSAEQVFCEVMLLIDEVKYEQYDFQYENVYSNLSIEYRQEADDVSNDEINNIVSIIVATFFSILGTSEYNAYRSFASELATICIRNNKGLRHQCSGIFTIFDQSCTEIGNWLDNEYMHEQNQEYISEDLQRIVSPNHYSKYQIRGLNSGKSDDEVHYNLLRAAQGGPAALVKYLTSNEGKVHFDFGIDSHTVIINTLNQELGTNIKVGSFLHTLRRNGVQL